MTSARFVLLPPLLLAACSTPPAAAAPAFVAATLVGASAGAAASPAALASAASRSRAPGQSGASLETASPLAAVASANRSAVREPAPGDYAGAVQVYPWSEGAVYRLYAAPGEVSDIALQPGEALVSVAAGDTARWVIGDTTSGAGAARQTHVLVKPSAANLSSNLLIATDRRVYHVEAKSSARTAMTGIAWTYPDDALLALHGASAPAAEPVSAGLAVDQLNFDYRIEGDNVPWRPLRAFDDGHQVFIQFPPSLADGEAPPLFVTGDKGRAELVNYRVRGRYYVVDRLFSAAELRMGEKRQQVVRIIRGGAARRARRGW